MATEFFDTLDGFDLDPGDIFSLVKPLLAVGSCIIVTMRRRAAKEESYPVGGAGTVQQTMPGMAAGARTREDHLAFDQVATPIEEIRDGTVRELDDNLKIAIAAAARVLREIPPEAMTWNAIMNAFTQHLLLEPAESMADAIDRAETFEREHTAWFSRKTPVVPQVHEWYARLVTDADIALARQTVDVNAIAGVVAHTTSWLKRLLRIKETMQKTLLDVGIVRYPDKEHPYIKVYRIELVAWFTSGDAGISGQFNARKFFPRLALIERMDITERRRALDKANAVLRGAGY